MNDELRFFSLKTCTIRNNYVILQPETQPVEDIYRKQQQKKAIKNNEKNIPAPQSPPREQAWFP